MQCDVTHGIICISNNDESLEKEYSWKNFTREVIYCEFNWSLQHNRKILDKILGDRYFNV